MNDSQGKPPVDIAVQEIGLTSPREGAAAQGPASQPGAALDRPTQGRIGEQLRAMYDDLVNQPVPGRLADLIRQLDRGGDDPAA